jgi:hypothetical protein
LPGWTLTEGESHNDGATIRDFVTTSTPGRRAVFLGNRIDCSSGNETGALFIQTLGADIDQVTLESRTCSRAPAGALDTWNAKAWATAGVSGRTTTSTIPPRPATKGRAITAP